MKLNGKIDFLAVITVENANPNGDPLSENRPRQRTNGLGEISDVCIKRKIRNRWQDFGARIFVQSDDRSEDGCKSLKERAESHAALKEAMKGKGADKETCMTLSCEEWMDIRAFGQVFAFRGSETSVGIRGPVSIQPAVSISPVEIITRQITKSVNAEDVKGKASDTMGTKYMVAHGLYVIKGSVNVQLAEKTGFSQEDAEQLRDAIRTLFENDASSARPEGTMEVRRLYWWQYGCKLPKVSSAEVFRGVQITPKVDRPASFEDYEITLHNVAPVEPEIYGVEK